jgi:LPXTG-motif cell wall-anchored protein
MEYVAGGKPGRQHADRYSKYKKLVKDQSSEVMACLRSAQEGAAQAKSSNTLMLVAGGAGALILGALLLKKKKR